MPKLPRKLIDDILQRERDSQPPIDRVPLDAIEPEEEELDEDDPFYGRVQDK